mgnify:CR=1 FL=1
MLISYMQGTPRVHYNCAVGELKDVSIPRPPVYVHLAGSRRAAAAALRGRRRVVFDDDHLVRPIVSYLLG